MNCYSNRVSLSAPATANRRDLVYGDAPLIKRAFRHLDSAVSLPPSFASWGLTPYPCHVLYEHEDISGLGSTCLSLSPSLPRDKFVCPGFIAGTNRQDAHKAGQQGVWVCVSELWVIGTPRWLLYGGYTCLLPSSYVWPIEIVSNFNFISTLCRPSINLTQFSKQWP